MTDKEKIDKLELRILYLETKEHARDLADRVEIPKPEPKYEFKKWDVVQMRAHDNAEWEDRLFDSYDYNCYKDSFGIFWQQCRPHPDAPKQNQWVEHSSGHVPDLPYDTFVAVEIEGRIYNSGYVGDWSLYWTEGIIERYLIIPAPPKAIK